MLINKYYDSSEQEEKKNEYYIQELQKYIHEKNISSKDADQLNRWVEQQKVLHVRVYKGDIVVFESEYQEQKLWEEEIPANEYEWMDYYPIEFADGSAQVNIWGIYDYQFYHYAMIVEVLFSFLLFLLLVLIGIRRKMDYILQLSKEIQILEGGSLEYAITVKGKDELSKLAEGIENMRKSFQRMIHKETEIVRENQKIVTEMSHDLRTPITSIMLYTEILKKGKYENEAQLLEYLKKIDQKARRMKQLSEHLFEYSLLSGEDEVKLEEPDNFETLLYDLFSETCSYLEQRGFQTIFQVRWPDKKIRISTDYMMRIMDNITSNIIKYADPSVPVKILSVDQGEMAGFCFENQIRLSGEKTQSNGIGLQSIKNMMEKMTGKCAVMKEKNGFRITILFPVADS